MAHLSLASPSPAGDDLPVSEQPRGRVLVVDDEPTIAEIVARYLQRAHYETRTAGDGHAALARASTWHPDLVVLDLMLPGLDGLEVMRLLREMGGERVSIILLTAKGEEADRIDGLRLGADDYVVKPFSPAELVARVEAVLRRSEVETEGPEPPLIFGGLEIDLSGRRVLAAGEEVTLTQREFDLLAFMMRSQGEVVDRARLHEEVWGYTFDPGTNIADVFVGYLRRKLESGGEQRVLHTVRGVGYVLRDP